MLVFASSCQFASQNELRRRQEKMQLKCSRVFFDFQHISCFICMYFFNNMLLTPVKAYPVINNGTVKKNYREMLVWNDKIHLDFILYLMIVLVIIILYILWLCSREDDNVINR